MRILPRMRGFRATQTTGGMAVGAAFIVAVAYITGDVPGWSVFTGIVIAGVTDVLIGYDTRREPAVRERTVFVPKK